MRGLLLSGRGEFPAALQMFELAAEDGVPGAAFNASLAHRHLGDRQSEWEWLRRAAAAGENDALINIAVRYREDGKWEEAEDVLRKAHRAGHPDAPGDLGLVLLEQNRLSEAEQFLREAVARGERTMDVVNLGLVLERRGDTQEAMATYRKLASAEPQAAYNLAVLLEGEGKEEEAVNFYRQAAAADHALAQANLGAVLLERRDIAGAHALLSSPAVKDLPNATANLGVLHLLQGNRSAAGKAFARAVELGAMSALLNLASMQRNDGDLVAGIETLRKAVSLMVPKAAVALGEALEESGDLDGARRAYGLEATDESSADYRLGRLVVRQEGIEGQFKSAVSELDEELAVILRSESSNLDQMTPVTDFASPKPDELAAIT
jgi:tetratricopeptide (TPR) repeat protein